jgi:hypothetical protein
MGPRFRSIFVRGAACAAIGLAAAAAGAQSVHEVIPGGDTVTGAIDSATDLDRIPFRLVEASKVTITLKAAKGSLLLPQLNVLGTDRAPDPLFNSVLITSKKGNSVAAKNVVVDATGLRWLEIRGANGTTGGWTLSFKVRLPKKASVAVEAGAAGPVDFPFVAPGNVSASLKVAAARGIPAPSFDAVRDPAGAIVPVDEVYPSRTGFSVPACYLGAAGKHALRVLAAGPGGLKMSGKWKVAKPFKRALAESQVITDPVIGSVEPTGGDTSQLLNAVVSADFLEPGAKVIFRKPPTTVTLQGAAITLAPGEARFVLNLGSFQKGVYDVEVENPDGGRDVLPKAFTVVNAVARPTSISPPSGFDNEVISAQVGGSLMQSQATVSLQRGQDSIPGTNLSGAGSLLLVDFDLRERAHGLWDLVVANPDADPAVLVGAFEIRNSPPVLDSVSPGHNLDGAVVLCTLLGSDLDDPATASLRRAGEPDIAGTSVVRISGTEVRATFDTTGAAFGAWDVVVANPDGQSDSLPGAFLVSGPAGPAAKSFDASGEAHGPVAVVHNADRNEFVAAWVDEGAGGTWTVMAQRLDAEGKPLGSAVSVGPSSSAQKREAAVAWNPDNDEILVAWAELVSVNGLTLPKGQSVHPSQNYSSLFQVVARRLAGSDLSAIAGIDRVIDATTDFPAGSMWYLEDFHNFRPSVIWDSKAGAWQIGWTQEWDTSGTFSSDDYDVMYRSLGRDGTMGTVVGVASSPDHEGDLILAWDPEGSRVLTAYNQRPSASAPLALYLGADGPGSAAVTDTSADLGDPSVAVDTDSGRLLVAWTRNPASGSRSVEAATFSLASPATRVGNVVVVGTGSGQEHLQPRALYNPAAVSGLVTWTRIDSGTDLSVRMRRAVTDGSGGLSLAGTEVELSGGSGDEAAPTAVANPAAGESIVFWLKGLSFTTSTDYVASTTGGTWRGDEIWVQRYR